jgi:hypothetical protein
MSSSPRLSQTATVEVIPSARRLIGSLRDLGYDFVHAVADLIDNSIAAKAGKVEIDVRFEGPDSWVRIVDDGNGMSGSQITEAMRYGAERDYDSDDLGKFGLGLKTASLSQCRRLTVASRTDPNQRRIEARTWDLDETQRTNRWEVFVLGPDDRDEKLTEPLQEHSGTVVLWQSLERVLDYKISWGEKARAGLFGLVGRLDEHLGMVFHRFLTGQARRRKKLSILINGTPVEPWDPFVREEKATESFDPVEFEIHGQNGKGIVRYHAYILPNQANFSNPRAFQRAGGPNRWNSQQGFYIYRADRMIQSGGWSRMRTPDEHTKLARAALDFYPDLDSEFQINVAKVRVTLPAELKDDLKEPVERLAKRAQLIYRQKETSGAKTSGTSNGTGRSAYARSGSGSTSATSSSGRTSSYADVLEAAAAVAGEKPALRRIVKSLKSESPEVARELGW